MKIKRTNKKSVVIEECDGSTCKYGLPNPEGKKPNVFGHAKLELKTGDDGDDNFYIEGYASTEDLDRGNDIVHADAFANTIKNYLTTNPILLYMHDMKLPIGRIVEANIDKAKGLFVKAMVSVTEQDIRIKIKEKILVAFSFGFFVEKSDEEIDKGKTKNGRPIRHVRELELLEISIVSIGMNRLSLFNMAKAFEYGSDVVVPQNAVDDLEEKILDLIDRVDDTEKQLNGKLNDNDNEDIKSDKKDCDCKKTNRDAKEKEIDIDNVDMDNEKKAGRVLSAKSKSIIISARDAALKSVESLNNVLSIGNDDKEETEEDDDKKSKVVSIEKRIVIRRKVQSIAS